MTCTHHWTVTSPCPKCQQDEIAQLRRVLRQILDLYPYLHCVCGRVKDRIKEDVRVEARKLLADDPLTRGRLTAKIGHDRTAEK